MRNVGVPHILLPGASTEVATAVVDSIAVPMIYVFAFLRPCDEAVHENPLVFVSSAFIGLGIVSRRGVFSWDDLGDPNTLGKPFIVISVNYGGLPFGKRDQLRTFWTLVCNQFSDGAGIGLCSCELSRLNRHNVRGGRIHQRLRCDACHLLGVAHRTVIEDVCGVATADAAVVYRLRRGLEVAHMLRNIASESLNVAVALACW